MTPEERSLLQRTNKLAQENNDILRSMRRMTRFSFIFRALYWVVIIGASLGAYYLIQPYAESIMSLYKDAQGVVKENMTTVQNINSTVNGVKSLIK